MLLILFFKTFNKIKLCLTASQQFWMKILFRHYSLYEEKVEFYKLIHTFNNLFCNQSYVCWDCTEICVFIQRLIIRHLQTELQSCCINSVIMISLFCLNRLLFNFNLFKAFIIISIHVWICNVLHIHHISLIVMLFLSYKMIQLLSSMSMYWTEWVKMCMHLSQLILQTLIKRMKIISFLQSSYKIYHYLHCLLLNFVWRLMHLSFFCEIFFLKKNFVMILAWSLHVCTETALRYAYWVSTLMKKSEFCSELNLAHQRMIIYEF